MTIGVRHHGRGMWGITSTGYSKALHLVAKSTPGMRWSPEGSEWTGYVDAIAVCVAGLRAKNIRIEEWDKIPEPGTKFASTIPIKEEGLRDYQKEGVRFLVTHAREGAILADGMRLGKSAQALRAARALGGSTLVLCPGFVKGVWIREAKKWWPEVVVFVLHGTRENTRKILDRDGEAVSPRILVNPDRPILYICNYQIIGAWAEQLKGQVSTIILDEAHMLQGEKTARAQGVREVANAATNRMALTGTPMTSRPRDLWNLVDTISEGRFGKPYAFYARYCNLHEVQITPEKRVVDYNGTSNETELHDRLARFMLRRTAREVSTELPLVQRQVVEVDVPKGCIVSAHMAMRDDSQLRRALDLAADGKLPAVIDLIESHRKDGAKVVVFTHRRAMAEAIAEAFPKEAGIVHGGYTQKKRDAVIESAPGILCCTMDSTGVGIDLSHYDVEVFAEMDWVPSKLAQCEARAYKLNSKKPLFIQYVVAEGSIDELIRDTVIKKLNSFEKIIGKLDDNLKKDLDGDVKNQGAVALRKLFDKLNEAAP